MKHVLAILLVAGGLAAPYGLAMDRDLADTLMHRAQEAYAAGDHGTALLLFDSVAMAYTSATLHYNIGNCHFKRGDIPHAILHYERALRLEPGSEDVRANLDLARQQVVDRINELPGFALGATWSRLRGGRDVDQWARRALWLCLALFTSLSAMLFLRNRWARVALSVLAAGLFLGTATAVSFAATRVAEVKADDEAIIMAAKVDVRSEPRSSGTVLFVLHKGSKVSVEQEQDGWLEVRLPNGNVGWMPSSSLERI